MITFDFEGQKVKMPTAWNEVTVEHFLKPEFLSGDALQLLSALSDIPMAKLANTTEDLTEKFEQGVKFMKDDPNGWMAGSTKELKILDVNCTIPENIEVERLGQKIMMAQELSKHTYYYSAIPQVIAIYLSPQIYPEDWYSKIEEVAEKIKQMPITKVYRIADFFLNNIELLRGNGIVY